MNPLVRFDEWLQEHLLVEIVMLVAALAALVWLHSVGIVSFG